MQKVIKSYKGYLPSKQHGIRCELNKPKGQMVLHGHDYYEIEIIRSGALAHELNGVREILRAGDVVGLSPKDQHRLTVLEPVEICNLCIYYKEAPSSVERLLSSVKFPFHKRLFAESLPRAAEYHARAAEAIRRHGPFEREVVSAHTTLLLAEILSGEDIPLPQEVAVGYTHIAHAMDFISEHLAAPLTLDEVAKSVHLSPSYFSKLFTEITGDSFVRYLAMQRVEYAKKLLASTDKSVTDIAFDSGFGSFSSFSRAFRAFCGTTPGEFRAYAKEQ